MPAYVCLLTNAGQHISLRFLPANLFLLVPDALLSLCVAGSEVLSTFDGMRLLAVIKRLDVNATKSKLPEAVNRVAQQAIQALLKKVYWDQMRDVRYMAAHVMAPSRSP